MRGSPRARREAPPPAPLRRALCLLALLASLPALAGGPRSVNGVGSPMAWPAGSVTYHPDLGPWTEANVEATIRLVRIVVARRRRDPHWRRPAMAIEDGDAIGTGEAAQILERTTEYVRKLIDRGLLEAFDWSLPGAKRADWRVSKKACFAFRDRNPTGRATGNSQHSQQSQHPAESWAFSL